MRTARERVRVVATLPGIPAAESIRTQEGRRTGARTMSTPFGNRRSTNSAVVGVLTYVGSGSLAALASVPFVYSLIVPLVMLDVWVTVYQAICLRLYRIARVRRGEHVVIDRFRLPYLNAVEKVHCVFCGYANGVLAYASDVAGRTEQYWCPIRHARRTRSPHEHYRNFTPYGDAAGYRGGLPSLRSALKK